MSIKVNPDLENERKKCTFNTLELTYFLDGGSENCKKRREKEEYFLSDPELKEKIPLEYLSHEEQYRECMRKSAIVLKKLKNLENKEEQVYRRRIGIPLEIAIFKDGNPLLSQDGMFIPGIIGHGSAEQQKTWLKQAMDMAVRGTFAQTELGHGTFVRGLETTATYYPNTEEFEINSPTISSYKWWPGTLGQTANHALVAAQLYTNGKCHGVHFFIVPIRDMKTHMPLTGIQVGEIGRKLGMNSTNNGFVAFNKVRIPRNYMLMKNAQVLIDGTYIKPATNKLMYATLNHVRVTIAENVRHFLAKAVTIAIRYSAVRRQSEMKPGEAEHQILDYQTQQYKLLPYLAYTYAFRFASQWIMDFYEKCIVRIEKGDISQLSDLHANTCCLKAVCALDATNGVEMVRLACGGHGYMTCSNLPTTYGLATAAMTYEGENTVLLLQTARALIKAWNSVKANKPVSPTMEYLTTKDMPMTWSNNLEGIVKSFKLVAAGKVARCSELLQRGVTSDLAPEYAWNSTSVQLVDAAEAHCRAFLVERYVEALHTRMNGLSPELYAVMQQLCELYCVFWVLRRRGDFFQHAGMRGSDVCLLEDWQSRLLSELRPNAVGLVDAFDFRDEIIDSALGAWDGQVYKRLLANALKSPLNSTPVHDSFHTSIAPTLKAKY